MADQGGEGLISRLEGGVLRLTIDRPDVGNAITPALREELIAELGRAGDDLAVRAVLLTATGDRHFCTGADLRAARPAGPDRPDGAPQRAVGELAAALRNGAQRLIAAVLDCPRPIVAAVNGTAAGLGANLALACDLVLAAESASFIQVFVRRGLAPDAGTAFLLPRLVGTARAKQLVFFGDDLSAADAERIGIVNRVVAHDALDKTVTELAGRLAALPPIQLSISKRLLNQSFSVSMAEALEFEDVAQALNFSSADTAEAMLAFVQKRDPRFSGE